MLPRVALQLWIVLFFIFFGAEVVHLEPGLRVIAQLLYGVPLAAWALLRLRGPADRLEWAILGVLVVYVIICMFSRDRTESLGTVAMASAYAAWFMLMRRAAVSSTRLPVVLAVATGLATTLIINACLLIAEKLDSLASLGAARFEGTLTFPWESVNALPVLVLVAIPFVAMVPWTLLRTAMGVAVALSAIVVVPLSMGRAGWAGLAVAGVVLVALFPATGRAVRRVPRRVAGPAVGALALLSLLGLVVVGPRLVTSVGESGRLLIWDQAIAMIRSSPWIGSGPSVYSWARLEFPPAGADLLEVRLVHSAALQTLIEGGAVLMAGLVALLAGWAVTVARGRRDWTMQDRLALASIAGFLIALTLDDFSYLPAIIAAFLTLGAFLCPISPSPRRAGWIAPGVLALATLAALPSVIGVDVARTAAQQGRSLMAHGEYAAAMTRFEIATSSHPESGGYWLGLGMAAAYAGDRERAVEAYQRSIDASPGDPRGYAALASIGPEAERLVWLRSAAERSLDDPQDAALLGKALAEAGDSAGAIKAWGAAVALRPEVLRLLPYDGDEVTVGAVAAEARRLIGAHPRPAPHENLAALWDIALVLDQLPDDAGPAWLAVDAARKGDLAAASALASAAVMAAPFEARGHQAGAAVAAFACDEEAERRALSLDRKALGAYQEPEPGPRAVREFLYREASLAHSQPPGARLDLRIERWPWSLVDRPEGCGS